MSIPVYDEVGFPRAVAPSTKQALVTFTYDNWDITNHRHWIFLSEDQRTLTKDIDYTIDAENGEIGLITTPSSSSVFASDGVTGGELPPGWEITARYHFKYFTDDDILAYLNLALDFLNMRRPVTGYTTLDAAPAEFRGAMIIYAYYRALMRILIDNQLWNNNLIWANREQMHAMVDQLKEESYREWQEESKFAKPRSFAKPRAVTSGRYGTQQRVTSSNFQHFTIVGGAV